jgi:hypothetical protein
MLPAQCRGVRVSSTGSKGAAARRLRGREVSSAVVLNRFLRGWFRSFSGCRCSVRAVYWRPREAGSCGTIRAGWSSGRRTRMGVADED